MTGIHYDDLTQIHTPVGLLDEDTRGRLRACKRVEAYVGGKWVLAYPPKFQDDIVYREAPPVERPIDVDHHALGPGVYCWARDEDGEVYAYSCDPEEGEKEWHNFTDGRMWSLTGLSLLRDPGEGDWRKSKVINPLCQGGKS